MTPTPAAQLADYLKLFPEETQGLQLLADQLAQGQDTVLERSNMQGHIVASCFVLNSARTHALVIDHLVLKALLSPGGHYETLDRWKPDSLYLSAIREVEEETGVSRLSSIRGPFGSSLIDIDTHPIPANPAKGEGAHVHHDFMFLVQAGYGQEPVPQLAEVSSAAWAPLADIKALDTPRFNRVLAKVSMYVEHALKRG